MCAAIELIGLDVVVDSGMSMNLCHARRPLLPQQETYAALDAVALLLIYECTANERDTIASENEERSTAL